MPRRGEGPEELTQSVRVRQLGLLESDSVGAISVGGVVRTNYGSGPYVVTSVSGPCTCPSFVDELNMDEPPRSRPHIHMSCTDLKSGKSGYSLNGYDPETLQSVWGSDYITVIG